MSIPAVRPPALDARRHRPWSTVLLSLHIVVAACSVVVVVFAGAVWAFDSSEQGDTWDGLIGGLAAIAAVLALVIGGGAVAFAIRTHAARRRADAGDQRMLRTTAAVGAWTSAVVLAVSAWMVLGSGAFPQAVLVVPVLLTGPWGLASALVLRATRAVPDAS